MISRINQTGPSYCCPDLFRSADCNSVIGDYPYLYDRKIRKVTHDYQITGMTCMGCEVKVKTALQSVEHVTSAEVSKDSGTATIEMDKHIPLTQLQSALGGKDSKYQISATAHNETVEEAKNWLETYKPILLIFGYITAITILVQIPTNRFDAMVFMRHFMAGFFLVFSFFKMLDLKGFAESYAMYDLIAKKMPAWGYGYAFIEFGLGIAYLTDYRPLVTNALTFVVMSVSIIGVVRSVLNKSKIRCACLGSVFNLPMTTVTIIEDALMIAMSGAMLAMAL